MPDVLGSAGRRNIFDFVSQVIPNTLNFHRQLRICLTANVHSITVWAALMIHGLLLGWISIVNAPMFDEIAHFPSGLAHWRLGTFDLYRVNPPLMRMIAFTRSLQSPRWGRCFS